MKNLLCLLLLTLLSVSLASIRSGDQAYDDGNYIEAISQFQAAYEATGSVEALYKLAKATTLLAGTVSGDEAESLYEQAADYAREAIALDPEEAEAHFELGRALGRLAQFRGIFESLNLAGQVHESTEEAIRLDPQHDGAYHALALWHLEVPWIAGGRISQVALNFEQAIAIAPDAIVHRLEFGKALLRLDEREAAKAMLESALSLEAITFSDRNDQEAARLLLEQEF